MYIKILKNNRPYLIKILAGHRGHPWYTYRLVQSCLYYCGKRTYNNHQYTLEKHRTQKISFILFKENTTRSGQAL